MFLCCLHRINEVLGEPKLELIVVAMLFLTILPLARTFFAVILAFAA